jgi:N-methylhydantoinase A
VAESTIKLDHETEHYFVFVSNIIKKKLFTKKNITHVIILDKFGRLKLSVNNGKIFYGEEEETKEKVKQFLKSRNNDIAPQVHLLTDLKLIDYSSLTSNSGIINAIEQEYKESKKVAVIIEI